MFPNHAQLKKMLIIETMGEEIYKALSSKTKDENLKSIYQRLALAEAQTAKNIEKEISLQNNQIIFKKFIADFSGLLFNLLTAKQILWILKNTLKRRMYKQWFDIYKDSNRDLWALLLKHEEFQHELLKF